MAESRQKALAEKALAAFEKQKDCDIFFEVEGKKIGAHKFIVTLNGQGVIENASGQLQDKGPILIDGVSFDCFISVLRYMYCGEVSNWKDNTIPLLHASKQFKMQDLEKDCVDLIKKAINVENVCTVMEEAINFGSMDLQQSCLEIFSEETDFVLFSRTFNQLSQKALSTFLEAGSSNVIEIILFWNVKLWMEQKCREAGIPVNGPNMRMMIGEALYKIHFPTMTGQDFANTVTTIKGLLTESEIAQVFQKIMVFDNANVECQFPTTFRCIINVYCSPVDDIEHLSHQKVLYKHANKQHCDFTSLLQHLKDHSDNDEFSLDLVSYRIVLQCFADLFNSGGTATYTTAAQKPLCTKIHDDFFTWIETAKTRDFKQTMLEFMDMRTQLTRLCKWTL